MTQPGSIVIRTAHLFRPLTKELIQLLRSLQPHQWAQPTTAGSWSVKDVVAHLLDGDLRRLSVSRDGYVPAPRNEIHDYSGLLGYLNELNAQWIAAALRLSPRVLCDCLEVSGTEIAQLMEAADPLAPATFPVAWAGQSESPMWLDIGREYTERWHHQDQIREAAATPPLRAAKWLRPALEVSLVALPHAYRNMVANPGTAIHLDVRGEAGGDWQVVLEERWNIRSGRPADPAATIRIGDLDLTRLLLHRLPENEASAVVEVSGDARLAAALFTARAVMV